jgi:hypothetical protein
MLTHTADGDFHLKSIIKAFNTYYTNLICIWRGRYLSSKLGDIISNDISVEVCMSMSLQVINYSSKKYLEENVSLNFIVFLVTKKIFSKKFIDS